MNKLPIFQVGTAGLKQATVSQDGQWHYRIRLLHTARWGPWIRCTNGRPPHAWYDPLAGNARLPELVDTRVNKDYYDCSDKDDE